MPRASSVVYKTGAPFFRLFLLPHGGGGGVLQFSALAVQAWASLRVLW